MIALLSPSTQSHPFEAQSTGPLLAEEEVMRFTATSIEVIEGSDAALILLCEHASPRIPEPWQDLGLPAALLSTHFAWDMGSADLTRQLARRLSATAVLANYSRLFIDINRSPDAPDYMRRDLSGIPVPKNLNISPRERLLRARICCEPFDWAVSARLGIRPALVSVHSFSPVFDGLSRATEIGILWTDDSRIGRALLAAFRTATRFVVGDNDPYDMRSASSGSLFRLGRANGLPFAALEIRSDLLTYGRRTDELVDVIASVFSQVLISGCGPSRNLSPEENSNE